MITGYSRRHAFALRKEYLTKVVVAISDKPRKTNQLLTRKQRNEILDVYPYEMILKLKNLKNTIN